MVELRGNALMAMVITLTSLGFMLIGWDNGLLGGVGTLRPGSLCNADADDEQWTVRRSMIHLEIRIRRLLGQSWLSMRVRWRFIICDDHEWATESDGKQLEPLSDP